MMICEESGNTRRCDGTLFTKEGRGFGTIFMVFLTFNYRYALTYITIITIITIKQNNAHKIPKSAENNYAAKLINPLTFFNIRKGYFKWDFSAARLTCPNTFRE